MLLFVRCGSGDPAAPRVDLLSSSKTKIPYEKVAALHSIEIAVVHTRCSRSTYGYQSVSFVWPCLFLKYYIQYTLHDVFLVAIAV